MKIRIWDRHTRRAGELANDDAPEGDTYELCGSPAELIDVAVGYRTRQSTERGTCFFLRVAEAIEEAVRRDDIDNGLEPRVPEEEKQ